MKVVRKFSCFVLLIKLACLVGTSHSFSTLPVSRTSTLSSTTTCNIPIESSLSSLLSSSTLFSIDRRSILSKTAEGFVAGGAAILLGTTITTSSSSAAWADEYNSAAIKTVVVAGATGQTGRRILERLAATEGLAVVAGVRNVEKAEKTLAESSTVLRGAMIQQVGAIDTSKVNLKHLDIVMDSSESLTNTLRGADSLVIAVGFVPSNPLKMNEEAHKVDNVGTVKLIEAAKAAGVKKVVMVSSILTNGREWGQEKSPGFVVTNAFGKVLDEKIVAERYLRSSGLDYTIVRPGGLKAQPPSGPLIISGEDTLNAGEVSRDLVADVCVASLTDAKASNKVLEIIEDNGKPPEVFNGLKM